MIPNFTETSKDAYSFMKPAEIQAYLADGARHVKCVLCLLDSTVKHSIRASISVKILRNRQRVLNA